MSGDELACAGRLRRWRRAELSTLTVHLGLGVDHPYERLTAPWHTVLLNQFHDTLPGSSIAWVHQVAEAAYETVRLDFENLVASFLAALASPARTDAPRIRFNASSFTVVGGAALSAGPSEAAGAGSPGTS